MVATHDVRALRLLNQVHQTREAIGFERLSRRLGNRRAVYRWMQRLRGHVTYYPRVAFAGLGLVHVHLFISNAAQEWFTYPYAIDRAWTIDQPGHYALYLHCLLPSTHLDRVPQGTGITSITTSDGWQDLAPLDQALDDHGRPIAREATPGSIPRAPVTTTCKEEPFLLPVATELLNAPPNMDALWGAIHERLGARVWEYLPRSSRRWPHNGKFYVRTAFNYLNRHAMVLQHVVHYAPLQERTFELFLLAERHVRDQVVGLCPTMEAYPAADALLLRVRGDDALLKRVITTPGIRRWWFVEHERTAAAPSVRFAYETLFDPASGTWQVSS